MLFIPEEKRAKGMEWAQRMLGNPNAVIIDTETTGLSGSAEVNYPMPKGRGLPIQSD